MTLLAFTSRSYNLPRCYPSFNQMVTSTDEPLYATLRKYNPSLISHDSKSIIFASTSISGRQHCYSLALLNSATLNERQKMAILTNNNNYDAPKKSKNDKISTLLSEPEIESVRIYLGAQLWCVDSGVTQLLQADRQQGHDRLWTYLKVGLMMYCREKHSTPSLRLVDPIEGERARELWRMDLKEDFITQRSSSQYLLTLETRDGDVIGLNFSDSQEADSFQQSVHLQRESREKRNRKADRGSYIENAVDAPLRSAPPPPGGLSDSSRSDPSTTITSTGVLPMLTKEEKKEKKNSIFKTLTNTLRGKKNKKKRPALTTLDIGNPTNFEHRKHVGLEKLDEIDKMTVDKLAEQFNVNKSNQKEMQVLIDKVLKQGEAIRHSLRMPSKQKDLQPSPFQTTTWTDPPLPQSLPNDPLTEVWNDDRSVHPISEIESSVHRSPGGSLVDARNSIKLGQKGGSRKTPHTIKQANQPRTMGRIETSASASTSTISTTTTMNTVSSWMMSKDESPPPPTPQRTTSRREPSQAQVDRPRLWDRNPPKEYPSTPKLPSLVGKEKSEQKQKVVEIPMVAPIVTAPLPPPPLPNKTIETSPPPPPPPLPPTLQVNAPREEGKCFDGDGSAQPADLMAAIRNFSSQTALRPVSSLSVQTISPSPNQPSSPHQMPGDSILMSIQMELEKRRVHISCSESESDDDSSSDSDWK